MTRFRPRSISLVLIMVCQKGGSKWMVGPLLLTWFNFNASIHYKVWDENTYPFLTLNVPVPYEYGTHLCVEPRFHALEPHLSRTSRALPTRVPRTRAAVRRRPRNSHSHASRSSAHFHAFAGRSSAHFHTIGSRSFAHFHTIRSRRSANFDDSISHAFPRIPAQW